MAVTFTKQRLVEQNEGPAIQIPTGGSFASGFIGRTLLSIVWKTFVRSNIVTHNRDNAGDPEQQIVPLATVAARNGNGYHLYFATKEDTQRALDLLGETDMFPSYMARVEVDVPSILNFSDPALKSRFGEVLDMSVDIKSLRSKKYRHGFHLIFLPAFISAVARSRGADLQPFDLSELTDAASMTRGDNARPNDEIFNDAFFESMCGSPDDKDGWASSTLGIQRAALWADLGELDPAKCSLSGKSKTDAEPMRECLDWLFTWSVPYWCRVEQVPDPRVGNVSESDDGTEKQRTIPVITEFFDDEAHALRVATAEIAEIQSTKTAEVAAPAAPVATAPAAATAEPPLPSDAAWAGVSRDGWVQALESVASDAPPAAAAALEVPIATILAWRKHLKS